MSQQQMPVALDPLDFPLHGSRLIEASAGTGKTFTIALLYARLVLDHGGERFRPAAEPAGNPRGDLHRCGDPGTPRAHPQPPGRSGALFRRAAGGHDGLLVACASSIPPSAGRAARARCAWPRSGWTRPRYRPSTVGATDAAARLRQRQPVHPEPGNRPERLLAEVVRDSLAAQLRPDGSGGAAVSQLLQWAGGAGQACSRCWRAGRRLPLPPTRR